MAARIKLMKVLWKGLAPFVGLAALALALYFYFHSSGDSSYRLNFTAGNAQGMRHHLALKLASEVKERNISLVMRPSSGSEEALDWVNSRKVDVALVQGALTTDGRPNVRQVAALHVEPLHLLVKKELFHDAAASLTALRGKTIDMEEVGSGTNVLASAVLDFVGIQPRDKDPVGGYIPLNLDRERLFEEKDAARLPDAVFLVSSLPSSTTTFLVAKRGYRLVPLPFGEAFALESLAKTDAADGKAAAQGGIVMGRIQAVTLPAFTYGVDPPVPNAPLPTLGARLLLVAHKDVPAKAAYQLVEATYASQFGQVEHPPLDPKLMDLPPEFPWHAGALLYQQRNAPVLSGPVLDSTRKWIRHFRGRRLGLVRAMAMGQAVRPIRAAQGHQQIHRTGESHRMAGHGVRARAAGRRGATSGDEGPAVQAKNAGPGRIRRWGIAREGNDGSLPDSDKRHPRLPESSNRPSRQRADGLA